MDRQVSDSKHTGLQAAETSHRKLDLEKQKAQNDVELAKLHAAIDDLTGRTNHITKELVEKLRDEVRERKADSECSWGCHGGAR